MLEVNNVMTFIYRFAFERKSRDRDVWKLLKPRLYDMSNFFRTKS